MGAVEFAGGEFAERLDLIGWYCGFAPRKARGSKKEMRTPELLPKCAAQ